VIAERIKGVLIEPRRRAGQYRAQLLAEYSEAETLRRLHLPRLPRDRDLERCRTDIRFDLAMDRHAVIVRTARHEVERLCIPSFVSM
jgi:hypothetical protein